MPLLYRIYCEHCDAVGGKDQPTYKGFESVAVIGGEIGGVITQGWHLSVMKEDGEWVPIRHPIEESDMKSSGYTWWTASIRGRIIHTEEVFCENCGIVNEDNKLDFPSLACCLPMLVMAIVSLFLPIGFWKIPVAIFFYVGGIILPTQAIRLIYWERNKGLRIKNCHACGGGKFRSIESARSKPVICPRCRQRTQKVEAAGMS